MEFPHINFATKIWRLVFGTLAWLMLLLPSFSNAATVEARIEVLGASPRDVAASAVDIFDEVSAGLEAVGIGQKVYLGGEPVHGSPVASYQWLMMSRPSGSSAALSATSGEIVSFRADRLGVFVISMTPRDASNVAGATVTVSISAGTFVGAGVFNTHQAPQPRAPQCGTGFCHGGSNAKPELNVTPKWIQSNHAQKLQLHMSGQRGQNYNTSCLPCHTVGFNTAPDATQNGFDDVADAIDYDLIQIPQLVSEAFTTQTDLFPELPAPLQNLASIQCESCHGPGSAHPSHLTEPGKRIAGVNLDTKQCAVCHDSTSGFQQGFYQWNTSSHPVTADASEGHVAETASCIKCHTGEGFVDVQVKGNTPTVIDHPNSVTCSTCHDPHDSNNAHQLRVAGTFTFDSGHVAANPGLGGLCMRCHNSRVADAETTALTSSRGAHHGPESDMLMGINGNSFGMSFSNNSAHINAVENTCVTCHMAEPSQSGSGVTNPPAVGAHTFSLRDEMGTPETTDDELNVANACTGCHSSVTTDYDRRARGDYDGDGVREGIQTEVRGLFDILRPGILAFPGTTINTETQVISIDSTGFASLTPNQKRALYNYNFVLKDGSFGVHNTSYAVQLLQRSYLGVYGRIISEDYPDMALRGPLVETRVEADWTSYQ